MPAPSSSPSSSSSPSPRQVSPRELGLNSDSFTSISPDIVTRRAIFIVEGGPKVGKTDWCLRHLPDPIVVFNFDQGLEGVAEKFPKKTIIPCGVPLTPEQKRAGIKYPSYHFMRPVPAGGEAVRGQGYMERVKKSATPIWERFIRDYHEALKSKARSLVVDTGGACFQLAKFAFIGMDKATTKDDPYGQKGGEMKSIFQGLMTDGYNYDKNVVWIHRLKDEWKGGEPSGGQVPDGYAQAPFEVQFSLRLRRETIKSETKWNGELRHVRLGDGARMNGFKFGRDGQPPLDFPTVMGILTSTEPEDWE